MADLLSPVLVSWRKTSLFSILAWTKKQSRRQRLAIQRAALCAPNGDKCLDAAGARGGDARSLQFRGDLVAQRLWDIQASVADDTRRPQEQQVQLQQLCFSPIEILKGGVGARN